MYSRSELLRLFGENAVDVDELGDVLGVPIPDSDRAALEVSNLPELVLHGTNGSHVLLPALPYSLAELQALVPEVHGLGLVNCAVGAFAQVEHLYRGWYLVPHLKGSGRGASHEAIVLFHCPDALRIPTLVEVVWATAVWCIAGGELLFRNLYLHASVISQAGSQAETVKVGIVPYSLPTSGHLRFQLDVIHGR